MQLCHGYDEDDFPFVIVIDDSRAQVFILNLNTQKRVRLIDHKKVHQSDAIYDI